VIGKISTITFGCIRTHAALNGKTPYEVIREKLKMRAFCQWDSGVIQYQNCP